MSGCLHLPSSVERRSECIMVPLRLARLVLCFGLGVGACIARAGRVVFDHSRSSTCMVPAPATPIATIVISLTQNDLQCPSSRACPGVETLRSACGDDLESMSCESSWSTGMVGSLFATFDVDDVAKELKLVFKRHIERKPPSEDCSPACVNTISALTVQDSLILTPVSEPS